MEDQHPGSATWPPSHCLQGHALTAKRVLFGSRGGQGSRWAYCRTCGMEGSERPGAEELTWTQEFISDVLRVAATPDGGHHPRL